MLSLEFFSDTIFRSHYGPGVDSASNRNEYQVHFPGGKGGRCVRLTLPPSCVVVIKSGNLNFLEPSRPLQACNGTVLPLPCNIRIIFPSKLDLPNRASFSLFRLNFCNLIFWTGVKIKFMSNTLTVLQHLRTASEERRRLAVKIIESGNYMDVPPVPGCKQQRCCA